MATTQKTIKKSVKKSVKDSTYVLKDTYQEVTDAVIKALEEGTVIWNCSWNKIGFPKNITTDKNYRGWNIFWLNFHTMIKGYQTPFYITYKQAAELGGTIKKGQKGVKITYWATIELKSQPTIITTDFKTGEDKESYPTKLVPKDYTVFNIDQAEGIDFPKVEAMFRNEAERIEACEKVIAEMPLRPTIEYRGDQAYYDPALDTVVVPKLEAFQNNESYYSVLFHELAHSTGHKSRLNRKEFSENKFGDEDYSKEELTAELTAAFLSATTGIEQKTLPNSAAYIKGWLKALKNDKTLLLKAAAQAQKAADYILSASQDEVIA